MSNRSLQVVQGERRRVAVYTPHPVQFVAGDGWIGDEHGYIGSVGLPRAFFYGFDLHVASKER